MLVGGGLRIKSCFHHPFASLIIERTAINHPAAATFHITYTMDEAQRVRHAVEGLLIIMAGRFDENGDPKA